MNDNRSLLSSGLGMVGRSKRYIFWFWLLNLVLAAFGSYAFRQSAHTILDHSLYSDRLLHGFDVMVLTELIARPEFGPLPSVTSPAFHFAVVFSLATALFLPGVFQGYAATYRLPREDFFRACGRNLWRFIRLICVAAIVMGIVAGVLFGIQAAVDKKAVESTNELLPFRLQMTCLAVIFLVMTTLRIWFDLAEVDVVLSDQRAVRKSIGTAFRHTFQGLRHLLASYVVAAIVAAAILAGGIWVWIRFVPTQGIVRAFLLGQMILYLLLIPRFWQRGVAVSYWKQKMMVPVASVPETATQSVQAAPANEPPPPVPAAEVPPTAQP